MFMEVLKQMREKRKNVKSNYYVTNSQINDELYTWDVVMNNKK